MNGVHTFARFLARAAALALVGTAGVASAAAPDFYMSGAFGQSSANMGALDEQRLKTLMANAWFSSKSVYGIHWSDTKLDRSDQGFEIAVGYQFTPHLAVEGAYIDLGDVTYDVPMRASYIGAPSPFTDAMTRVVAGRSGPALSLVGTWPVIGAFSLDARAGAFFGRSAATVTYGPLGESPLQEKSSSRSNSYFASAGMNWSLSPKTAIRLGYAHFSKGELVHHEVGRISLGLKVSF